jgi:superfamily I DNA/RNA helicase
VDGGLIGSRNSLQSVPQQQRKALIAPVGDGHLRQEFTLSMEEENGPGFQSSTTASFEIDLQLPPQETHFLEDAKKAIRREYRDASQWKRLQCRNVTQVSTSNSGTVFELQVGHAVEFDWTWEGAIAFRPFSLKAFEDEPEATVSFDSLEPTEGVSVSWKGEVLEVDEATGRIFVVVTDPEAPPRRGSFYVRPFEFLAFLDAVYNTSAFESIRRLLPERLAATAGGIHPEVRQSADVGLPILRSWWRHSWSVLWGPPGTGKTYTAGLQISQILSDPTERILVVSTTNRATDAIALSVGRAAKKLGIRLAGGKVRRIGKGASFQKYADEQLQDLLTGTETDYLAQIESLATEVAATENAHGKAILRMQIKELLAQMIDSGKRNFLHRDVKVVVSTAFKATMYLNHEDLKTLLKDGKAPFTTVMVDEAGLMSRVAIAALSLLASRRVVLIGDSKQLAPISRISRILEPSQGNWLARSGLSHLDRIHGAIDGVHILKEQYRMNHAVCQVVSQYQYDGFLTTAADIATRPSALPATLRGQPRAIWYVLDEDVDDLPAIRAERGPGNRSWVRVATTKVLKKLFSDPSFRTSRGLFISPFRAQAKEIHTFLAANQISSWMASTVHSQQGAEADIVIFDTVNAGSYGWGYDEWKRLVNVAVSRAREAVIFLASRAEMEEPYLRPLLGELTPQVTKRRGAQISWENVAAKVTYQAPNVEDPGSPYLLGNQLAKRKQLRPVLSNEQERLCNLELDGKPRLVRGVAGSGKTVVLAHWLAQTVQRLAGREDVRIWAVFANRSLQALIGQSIVSAWEKETNGQSFPWDRVELHHVRDILAVLLPEVGLDARAFEYEYDVAAEAFLERKPPDSVTPRCDALFVDEAQDMGPNTLQLLSAIVRRTDESDENSRSVNIFYDNAQNIYGRSTPKWSDLGLDMRGRSTVMKESFRSTKPITEFALNVLYRLQPPDANADHKELISRGLIEYAPRDGRDWWNVRFNQIDGPKPEFRRYANLQMEFEAIGDYCRNLIRVQGVQPSDICLIYNGKNIPYWLEKATMPKLAGLGINLSVQTNKPFERSNRLLLATTSNSFKGYDAEVVIVPAVDQYKAKEKGILANNLYVAMTRARSVLTLFGQSMKDADAIRLYQVIEDCLGHLQEAPVIHSENSEQDDVVEIAERIGVEHRSWLLELMKNREISQEPITSDNGEIIAEPLFWFRGNQRIYACFGTELPRKRIRQRLEDSNATAILPGESLADLE